MQNLAYVVKRDFSATDVAIFVALQTVLEDAKIRVVDIDMRSNMVEVRWADGSKEWLDFEDACESIERELNLGKEANHENASRV